MIKKYCLTEPEWCPVCNHHLILVDGKCHSCQKLKFFKEMEQKNIQTSKVGGQYADEQYTDFNFADKNILAQCADYPNTSLYIWGDVGRGKTHLATALIRKCNEFNRYTFIDILSKVKETFGAHNSALAQRDLIDELCSKPLLIDNMGTEQYGEFTHTVLFKIVNTFYERKQKGLIITSQAELSLVGEISSRLNQMCKIINLKGEDWRVKLRKDIK